MEDLLFRLGFLDKEQVTLVGHSMGMCSFFLAPFPPKQHVVKLLFSQSKKKKGSVVSCEFAVRYPKMVNKVILLSSAGLTVQASLEHPFPALVHGLLFLIRSTSLLDAPIRGIASVLTTQANWYGITMKELEKLTAELDETEEQEIQKRMFSSVATHGSNIKTASAPSSDSSRRIFNGGSKFIAHPIPQPHQQEGFIRRTFNRFFWWTSPFAVAGAIVKSIGRRTLSKTTTRFLKSLNWLHRTWLYQSKDN